MQAPTASRSTARSARSPAMRRCWSRRRAGVLGLPAGHRGVLPAVEPGRPARSTSASCSLLAFLLYPAQAGAPADSASPWYDALLAAIGFGLALLPLVFEADLIQRSGDPTTADLVVGTLFVVLLFEAARRVLGLALPIICGAVPALRPVRPVPAGRRRAPRLRLRPDRQPALPRHRGHLRHPDAGVGHLHLPVHPVRHASSSTPA